MPALLGDEKMKCWEREGVTPVYHYGSGRERWLRFALIEDARRYEAFPDVRQPVLILHGTKDDAVPIENSVRFVETHPQALLVTLESSHEMTDVTDQLWGETARFFELA